jgi:hypothetical protein
MNFGVVLSASLAAVTRHEPGPVSLTETLLVTER